MDSPDLLERDERLPERPLRHLPAGGGLVEVTTRTIQRRYLLKPTPQATELIEGCLGRALHENPDIQLVAYWFLSNHYGLLLVTPDSKTLSAFMNHLNGNLARELGNLFGWPERFWGRRYRAIYVATGEWVQVSRLRYLLSQGTKEGLIARPSEWPGASSLRDLTEGVRATGIWFNRTKEYDARRRKERFERYQYAVRYPIELAPLPCWAGLSVEERRARCQEIVSEIEDEAASQNRLLGRTPTGVEKILKQKPHNAPDTVSSSPAPLSHGNREERRTFKNLYWAFVRAYRAASERLRSGVLEALREFPPDCFLPRLPPGIGLSAVAQPALPAAR